MPPTVSSIIDGSPINGSFSSAVILAFIVIFPFSLLSY